MPFAGHFGYVYDTFAIEQQHRTSSTAATSALGRVAIEVMCGSITTVATAAAVQTMSASFVVRPDLTMAADGTRETARTATSDLTRPTHSWPEKRQQWTARRVERNRGSGDSIVKASQ